MKLVTLFIFIFSAISLKEMSAYGSYYGTLTSKSRMAFHSKAIPISLLKELKNIILKIDTDQIEEKIFI